MAHYAIRMNDGSVAVMETVELSPDACIAKWPAAMQANVAWINTINSVDVPADRSFRNAWTHDGKGFGVNMDKAREIQRDRLRQARAPLLADLDIQMLQAIAKPDPGRTVVDVEADKQALRDVTDAPAIEAAATPDALVALTVDTLIPTATVSTVKELPNGNLQSPA